MNKELIIKTLLSLLMKISSILISVLIFLLLSKADTANTEDPQNDEKLTTLTFYIEQEAEQAEDFIEMSFTILQKDNSLKKAIDKAKNRVQSIRSVAIEYCNKNGGSQCENALEVGKHQIAPIYQTVRRQPIFSGFSVTQQAVMQVKNTDNIGQLVDSILNIGVYQIDKFEWKPQVQADVQQIAIEQGISQARDLCNHINRQIGQVLAIEEVFSAEEDAEQGQQGGQQESSEEQGPSVLKFVVQCVPKNGQQPDFTPQPAQQQKTKEQPAPETKEKKKKKKKKE